MLDDICDSSMNQRALLSWRQFSKLVVSDSCIFKARESGSSESFNRNVNDFPPSEFYQTLFNNNCGFCVTAAEQNSMRQRHSVLFSATFFVLFPTFQTAGLTKGIAFLVTVANFFLRLKLSRGIIA